MREGDVNVYYTGVRKHSDITGGCGGSTNLSNWEYSWNPTGYNLLPYCPGTGSGAGNVGQP